MGANLIKRKLSDGRVSLLVKINFPKRQGESWKGKQKLEGLGLYLTGNHAKDKEALALATERVAQIGRELAFDQYDAIPTEKRKVDFLEYFANAIKGKSEALARNWQQALNHLRRFSGGSIQCKQINQRFLENFRSYVEKLPLAKTSKWKIYATARTCFYQAARDGLIDYETIRAVKPIPNFNPERPYLDIEKIKLLAAAPCPNVEIKRAFMFSCWTGLRAGDIENLQWSQITKTKNGEGETYKLAFTQKKTGKVTYLPLSQQAVEILYQGDKTGNIVEMKPKPFDMPSSDQRSVYMKKWCKAAKIEPVPFHSGRHSFATLYLTMGGDIYTLSKLLGHSSVTMTQIYGKIIDEKLRQAASIMPKIEMPFLREGEK